MILKNQKLDELEKYCFEDSINNAFALWDLRYERSKTEFYVDWDGQIRGYMLVFNGSDVPSIIVNGSEGTVKMMLETLSVERAVIHLPYEYMHLWSKSGTMYKIEVMTAEPEFYSFDRNVVRIRDGEKLKSIFKNPEYLVDKAITFGILKENLAVSVASALVHIPEVWVLGAVATKKEFRNQGFATRIVRHFMSCAKGKTDRVVLWVRSDNYPAIHLYEKFGFKKFREDGWINVGVNIIP